MEKANMEPVHMDAQNGQWYFWDETWASRIGPFPSQEEAAAACARYAEFLDNGPPNTEDQ